MKTSIFTATILVTALSAGGAIAQSAPAVMASRASGVFCESTGIPNAALM